MVCSTMVNDHAISANAFRSYAEIPKWENRSRRAVYSQISLFPRDTNQQIPHQQFLISGPTLSRCGKLCSTVQRCTVSHSAKVRVPLLTVPWSAHSGSPTLLMRLFTYWLWYYIQTNIMKLQKPSYTCLTQLFMLNSKRSKSVGPNVGLRQIFSQVSKF